MEESNLLKKRLQAITEKHRIQEDIRQKKLELDQEKLKLQHLKKKSLREQWLLQGAASHNATDSPQQQSFLCDQQQTRALQLNIHRIEMDILSLEREESFVSTNESFILDRLKAVEKSPEDIIKEAQGSFVQDKHELLQVTTVVPDVPECPSSPSRKHPEPNTLRKTLFAMQINVTKKLLTGESTVLSTATVPAEKLHQHSGLKVYDDGRKCIYSLNSQEGSHNQSCVSELSADEVEQLLRSATVHRKAIHQNYRQSHSRGEEICFYNHDDNRDREGRCLLRYQRSCHGDHFLRNNRSEKDCSWQRNTGAEHNYSHQENYCRRLEERQNQSHLVESHRLGNHIGLGHHYGNQKDLHHSLYEMRNCHRVKEDLPASRYTNGIIRSNSRVNGDRCNGCPPPRSHDQGVVSPYQLQLCYAPANYSPLRDYIRVDEEELYCLNQPSNKDANPITALYSGPAHSDRVPSPLYEDNNPYTILNTIDTTEPITAIFMGFQTAQDDSGQGQEFEGSLKAELVIIEDHNEGDCEDNDIKEKNSHVQPGDDSYQTGSSANGNMRQTQRRVRPGIKKIQKKHRHCCSVC